MKRKWFLSVASALLALSSLAITNQNAANENDVAIVGVTIIDVARAGHSTHDRPNATIVIRNGLVTAVGGRGQVAEPPRPPCLDPSRKYGVPRLLHGLGWPPYPALDAAYL